MYESPITLITEQIQKAIVEQEENDIYRAVQKYEIKVDKDELIKALKYDRRQYEKGCEDALNKIKTNLIEKLRTKQRGYLDLYDAYMDEEYYQQSLLLEEVIDIVKKVH